MKRYGSYMYWFFICCVGGLLGVHLASAPDMQPLTELPLHGGQKSGEITVMTAKKIQSGPVVFGDVQPDIPKELDETPEEEVDPVLMKPVEIQKAKDNRPAWMKNASALQPMTDKPKLVIIIDDLGLNKDATDRLAGMMGPFTLAYMPYADDLPSQTAQVKAKGHELLVHMPMQPSVNSEDPGINAMLMNLPQEEFDRRLEWNLSRFEGFVGINNHMGSAFTASGPDMARVMAKLRDNGYLFVDSLTTNASYGKAIAQQLNIPFAARDIFLDNVRTEEAIAEQLAKAARIAQIRGYAIAIGHPYKVTLDVLERISANPDLLPYELVPLTAIIDTQRSE